LSGAARTRGHLQHLAYFGGGITGKHRNANRWFIILEQGGADDLPVMREHGVRAHHLEQRGRQTVAIGGSGLFNRAPDFVGAQLARHRAGELDLRLLTKARA